MILSFLYKIINICILIIFIKLKPAVLTRTVMGIPDYSTSKLREVEMETITRIWEMLYGNGNNPERTERVARNIVDLETVLATVTYLPINNSQFQWFSVGRIRKHNIIDSLCILYNFDLQIAVPPLFMGSSEEAEDTYQLVSLSALSTLTNNVICIT